jgi:hypothetical protein
MLTGVASDPNYLNLTGQVLNLLGGLLLTIDAIGAAAFIDKVDNESDALNARMAKLGYTASINSIFVYVIVCFLGLVVLALMLPKPNIVLAFLFAPFTYFVWKSAVYLGKVTRQLINLLSPARLPKPQGFFARSIHSIIVIPWVFLYLAAFAVVTCIEFGIDLPVRFFSEKVVGAMLLRVLRSTARVQQAEERFHFRRNAFGGLMLLIAGFGYQALATVLQILAK